MKKRNTINKEIFRIYMIIAMIIYIIFFLSINNSFSGLTDLGGIIQRQMDRVIYRPYGTASPIFTDFIITPTPSPSRKPSQNNLQSGVSRRANRVPIPTLQPSDD